MREFYNSKYSSKKYNKVMNQQKEGHSPTLIAKLFQTLVLSKSKPLLIANVQFLSQQPAKASFYHNLSSLLSQCKSGIKNLSLQTNKFEVPYLFILKESLARKIVNTLMYLSKDITLLLDDGILNLYMDLIEMKERLMSQQEFNEEKKFVEECILLVEPLLMELFVFREYQKAQRVEEVKLKKSLSLVKQFQAESQQDPDYQVKPKVKRKQTLCEEEIAEIRQQIYLSTINQLLKQFLTEYQIQLNNLQQFCKICSTNIKLHHLQQHVIYCQKKYILKQDLKCLQKKIVTMANDLIAKRKNLQNSGVCHINSGPLTAVKDMDIFCDAEYAELLYEIVNVHRIGSLKNNVQKIHSENKIREHTEMYQELILKFESFLQKNQENQQVVDNVNHFLNLQRQILNLTLQLRTVELQYQNLRKIVSSSTIRPPSSTNKMSQKKSRFVCNNFLQLPQQNRSSRNRSCSSKVSFSNVQQPDSNEIDDKDQNDNPKKKNLQSYQNFDEDNLPIVTLKTKNSLGNSKIVHFHIDESQDEQKSPGKAQDSKIKRKIKSMVMFDDSDDSDLDFHIKRKQQEQNQTSQKSSCPQQAVGVKDFEILKLLGKGAFGKVYAVRKKNTSDLYALKLIDIDQNWGSQQFQQIRNQHQIFKKVAGEHLVQAPYCFSQGSVHVFVMEFMPGGDLSKVLEEEVYLQEERAKYVIAEIVLAIEHLHRANIIHRDLKPQNLVIDDRGHLKLTDFGLSQIKLQNKIQKITNIKKDKQEQAKRRRTRRTGIVAAKSKAKIIGTPDYIAPQIINSISINNRGIDWWSLGVISYEILIGVRPFCGNTIEEVLDNILKFTVEWPEIGQEQGMISEKAYDFIQRLLSKDFVNRLGAQDVQEIKNHPFFDGVNWEKLKHQPAHITPNYAKIKQLLEMQQSQQLRAQIEEKTQKTPLNPIKMPQLDNFIRFDILGQKTVKQANKVMSKKTGTLKRLQSIKDIMNEKENDPGQVSAKGQKKTWITSSEKRLNKAKRTELEISTMEEDI